MYNRIEQLDSIRGLAALAVLISHIPIAALSLPLELYKPLVWLRITNSHSSVMIFFILSGFVLSLPFLKKRKVNYLPYLVKRFFRIYIPYFFAISLAIMLSQLFFTENVETIGYWNMQWTTPVNIKLILDHIYFLGNFDSNSFNGPIWSLIHELRISLFFPFIVLIIARLNLKLNIIICITLSFIAGLNNMYNFQESTGYNSTYFNTIHYTALFILGALLAKHKGVVMDAYQKLNLKIKWLILFSSLFIYQFSESVVYYLYKVTNFVFITTHFWIIVEYAVAIGSLGLLISAIGSYRVEKFLTMKPFMFLGKISYSLYLYHLPVILTCIYLFHNVLPLWIICLIAIPLSLFLSSIAWTLVEKPSMNIGKKIAGKVRSKQELYQKKMKKQPEFNIPKF